MPLELRKFHGNGDCKFRGQEERRETFKCGCPFYAVGVLNGQRVRKSLRTADTQRALKLKAKMEGAAEEGRELATVAQVCESYLTAIHSLSESTRERRRLYILAPLLAFCKAEKIRFFSEISAADLDKYLAGRKMARTTEQHEMVVLSHLWSHALEREWVTKNIARAKRPPRPKPPEIVPFTPAELTRMMENALAMRKSYDRARARAILLLLRYTALRIGDAATLEKSRVANGRIHLHTLKTGQPVFLPLQQDLRIALARLPLPHGADPETCRWFFWNGKSERKAIVKSLQTTLATVFRGIPDAFPHRFRHTLASDLLARGYGEQQVADILGNSAAVVRKHYAKWYAGRQAKIDEIMLDYFGQGKPAMGKETVQ